jgi:nucleoid-associated protein EbfC
MNPFDLLKNLNVDDLKNKSQQMMEQLREMTVTGEAGGGFVKIVLNGEFNVLSIEYEENDIIKQDVKTFSDLIISAHNDAVSKMRADIQKRFSNLLIPGLF